MRHRHTFTPWQQTTRESTWEGERGILTESETYNLRRCTDENCNYVEERKA